jgi:hypothetical protein
VRRGHFRITSWIVLALALAAVPAYRAALPVFAVPVEAPLDDTPLRAGEIQHVLVTATAVAAGLYLFAQYLKNEVWGTVTGAAVALLGAVALVTSADLIEGWPAWLAALTLLVGAALLGGVTNGMMLGHWYLNQPGLKPWALARLTQLSLVAVTLAALVGLAAAGRLAGASTEGAVLGLPGFGENFGFAFYGIWLALLVFTGVVVWMARRCVSIRSIQSATGLYYVAILTAGVSEFLVRYLMVNAA